MPRQSKPGKKDLHDNSRIWDAVDGVNITLGLPIVRVSVDHGTAFDQAGSGEASPSSLINAIGYAARLAVRRKEKRS